MAPFWSGVAIGLAISAVLFVIAAAVLLLVFTGYALAAGALMMGYLVQGLRQARREHLAQIATLRAEMGLPPMLSSYRQAFRVSLKRLWRIMRHPIRERAFIAESFCALKNPLIHKWSDGLS